VDTASKPTPVVKTADLGQNVAKFRWVAR